MSRYEKYKDSGIAWIGEIPEGWSVNRHKQVMRKIKHIKEVYEDENIISLSKKGVIIRDLDAGGKMPTSFNGYQKVYAGNLLLCLFDIDVTPRCVGLIKNNGLSSPAYSQFELSHRGYAPYYDYLLRYMDDEKTLLHLSKNLRSSLTEDDFSQINTIVPTIAEQKSIAEFLNKKCGEIDELVSLQEKMIDELKSYKQSVITEAVTKGLDPNVPLRDSGIEWIGEIPEGWSVKRIKNICSSNTMALSDKTDKNYVFSYVDIGSVTYENGIISSETFSFGNAPSRARRLVKYNDIIVSTVRTYLRAIDIIDTDDKVNSVYSTGFAILTSKSSVIPKFLIHLCRSEYFTHQVSIFSNGINYPSINSCSLNRIMVIIPPLSEQQQIADYLDRKCGEIDELVSLQEKKIEELKEYKKSTIFEYVTGKKRVTN